MSVSYLDNAATTPVRREVLEAMTPYLTSHFGNPSSHHTIGEQAAGALADARIRVAAILGMRPTDVIFTSGATEANNLALKGVAIAAQQRRGARHVVTTPIEHESVLGSVDYLTRIHGFDATLVPVDTTGLVDPHAVAAAIRDDTAIVSVGYANNEIGTVQDVAGLVTAVAGRVPLHLDAVQAAGWLPLNGLGADALSVAGHKIGAPKGIGALGIRSRIPLEPVLHGGGQERERRSGTENVAGAVGLARALELAEAERTDAAVRVAAMRDDLIAGVLQRVPIARLTGHPTHRLPGTASFTFAGVNGETVLLELDRHGIITSSGSACAAGSEEASHVLLALGIDHDEARTAVRVTLGHSTTGSVAPIVDAIEAAVAAVGSGV
ncbi:cysteine desulfurase family protein [Microbacterium schleiferi]|uniref:cysteine desulfurase family protein n=1 Tax=Microbacterium schleiferi TaxID=69362 RepID=UPI001D176143|nr:cysteine desulfurase family protein [Microbacterium schleiferi]MCC4266577.1 cysteine desulfurase [Microbacterium schleiferi]